MHKSGGGQRCPCGQPLHYPDAHTKAYMLRQVQRFGVTVAVATPDGTWHVPRHYLALHGFRRWELKDLAAFFGWNESRNGNGHGNGHRQHGLKAVG